MIKQHPWIPCDLFKAQRCEGCFIPWSRVHAKSFSGMGDKKISLIKWWALSSAHDFPLDAYNGCLRFSLVLQTWDNQVTFVWDYLQKLWTFPITLCTVTKMSVPEDTLQNLVWEVLFIFIINIRRYTAPISIILLNYFPLGYRTNILFLSYTGVLTSCILVFLFLILPLLQIASLKYV